MYKSIVGNTKAGEKIASNNSKVPEELLHRIVEDLEDLKRNGGNSQGKGKDSSYRYLDDKTLYSTDG
jgi:hypothetical protein